MAPRSAIASDRTTMANAQSRQMIVLNVVEQLELAPVSKSATTSRE